MDDGSDSSFYSDDAVLLSELIQEYKKLYPMGEYSSKKSLSCCPGFFKNSYFADRQNGQFLKKFPKPFEGGVKCFKIRGKGFRDVLQLSCNL